MKLMRNEVNHSAITMKRYLFMSKLTINGILIVLLFIVIYSATGYSRQIRAEKERQATAVQVKTIMKLYHCDDPQIYAAIMETFDPLLVAIVIAVESEYRPNAVSPAGCRGLMQLSPDKLDDWRDVTKNIRAGSIFLLEQLRRFGSIKLAIAAYNAGPQSVVKYRGVPPYRETIRYLHKIQSLCFKYYPELFLTDRAHPASTRFPWHYYPEYAQITGPDRKTLLVQ